LTRVAYIDCVGGVAGDMLLAALLDAGADDDAVRSGLGGLGVEGLAVEVGRTARHGIAAARVAVRGAPGQPHRHWGSIREQIAAAGLPAGAAARAQETFRRLAEVEGAVHGIPPEQVHFHEVGAVDAIGEVCGVALALESLGVDRVVCSPLPVARGLVAADHGRLPLPAPATLELLKGAPIYGVAAGGQSGTDGAGEPGHELVTPTGAALVAALAEGFGPPPAMTLAAAGYGAGARDTPERPNVVRVLLGETAAAGETRPVSLIEANLDDLLPELAPDAAAACFAAGALDVWTTPAQMKHGRPGFTLSALARPGEESAVAGAMLRETSTLGVRIARLERLELERESRTVEVGGEPVRVKIGRLDGRVVNLAPEHADCERAARAAGAPVKVVWAQALAAAQEAAT
jgi:pyridinium-3,5-bisthiocarboxylic acid mononucleotide nickel chelatase